MDSLIAECQEKVSNHVDLIKFIRDNCRNREVELVKFAVSCENLHEKIKFHILSACFDSIEGRKMVIESASSSLLSGAVFEMILSEKIQKLDKEEFINILKRKENEDFKLKMIKKLFKHPKSEEIVDELIQGHSAILTSPQFYEALKFASTEIFVKNLPRCEKTSVPWKEFALFSHEKLLAFYESEFSKLKWHEYNNNWNYICSTLPNNCDNEVLKAEFLAGLLELYEKFPPYVCIPGKDLSESTPNYSEHLKIKTLLLKNKPRGDYSIILEHFKTPETWLKKPFQDHFIQSYENILFNWDLKVSEKEGMLLHVMNKVSDFNLNETDFERVPNEKFHDECWRQIFRKIFANSQHLNLKEFSLLLTKIEGFIGKSLEKIEKFKEIKDEHLFSEPLEISYFKDVLDKNFSFYSNFIKTFLKTSCEKFAETIRNNPNAVEKLPKIVEVIEKSMNLLNSYFNSIHQASKNHNEILYQSSLIHTAKGIYGLKDSILVFIQDFKLPLVTFNNQAEPDFYLNRQVMKDLAVRIDSELIKNDISSDWIGNWYKTFLSYLEHNLSLHNVPSLCESDFFLVFKSNLVELCSNLPFEKFKNLIINPTFEFLKKLDTFEFVHSVSRRFCTPAIKDLDVITSILAVATPKFIFYGEKLDKIFKANLILSVVKGNTNSKPENSFRNATKDDILDSLKIIFNNYAKFSTENGYQQNGNYKKTFKKPNYHFLFSSCLIKHFAEKFKFLLNVKNFTKDRDYNNFKSSMNSLMGFSHVLCRAIIAEFSEIEINEIIEKSSNESSSVFEILFLPKLSLDSKIVKTFVTKKIARLDTLEEKMKIYEELYSAAFEQNSHELSHTDALLAVSSFIQPKIARVDWKAKSLKHPFTAFFVSKTYLTYESPSVFTTPEHAKKVIEHLKIIWDDIWNIDPRSYIHEVENFCEMIRSRPLNDVISAIDMKLYDENVHELVITKNLYETFELWEDFLFDLQFNAVLRCKGVEKAQMARMNHTSFYGNHYLQEHQILKMVNEKTKIKMKEKFIEWHQEKMMKMISNYYPDMKLKPGDGKSFYNIKIYSLILNIAGAFEHFTPLCLDILDTISEYCRENRDDYDACKNEHSILNESLSTFDNFSLLPSLFPSVSYFSSWKSLKLKTKKNNPALFANYESSIEFLKRFINFHDEFGHLFVKKKFPLTFYYIAKYFIYQFEEPEKSIYDFQVDFFKSAIKICPSFIRTDDYICKLLMEKDPIFLFDVVKAKNPRLLSNGVFVSKGIPVFVIPFIKAKLPKTLSEMEISTLKNYFMEILLNIKLALQDRVIAAKWLADYLLELDEIFPDLYMKISDDPKCGKELKRLFLKNLYNSPEIGKVLKICFSELILNDHDSIVNVFSGLASKYSGNDFYAAVYPYIDPLKPENKEIFTSKLNFSSQKAFIQLISTLDNGKVLLEFWKRRDDYKEHFNMLIIKNILKILTDAKSTENSDLFLAAVAEAIKIGNVDTIKEILAIKPCKGLLDPIVRDQVSVVEGFVHGEIASKFVDLIQEKILEQEIIVSDIKISECLAPYCNAWYGFENFINDRHLSSLIEFVERIVIEDEVKNKLIKSVYGLFPIYSKFLSKKSRKDVDPYSHLNSHFQGLLSEIESPSSNLSFKVTISHLQKLNAIAQINKSSGKFDLSKYSTKNVHETVKYYQLSASIYENINNKLNR